MAAKETIRERQDGEFEVIKAIYGADVEDLRPKRLSWKPMDIRIMLAPLKGSSGDRKSYVSTRLHVVCTAKYPKIIPKIYLEDSRGLSNSLVIELLEKLEMQANSLKGEEMIYELAQTVQGFLHQHNVPPPGSLYDQMLEEQQKREHEKLNIKRLKESMARQTLLDKVEKRKEIFESEAKMKATRRSISETNVGRHRQPSTSDTSDNFPYGSHMYPNKCSEHRNSEKLYFPKYGRQIQKGCCLGHSQKGCVAYSGLDLDTGQLLYITEWHIQYSQLEAKCSSKCYWSGEQKCNGHKVDDFIASIEKHVTKLSQLNHRNLIQYECVLCLKRKDGVLVNLVQDFVLGTSVYSISSSLGWCTEGAKMVVKGVLESLIFLHNEGVSHNHLFDSTVFMDNTGTIRCTDFSLVPSLLELIRGQRSNKGDLPALGSLTESLLPTPSYQMRQFIEKCNSDRTLSASELFFHPFLRVDEKKDVATESYREVVCLDVSKNQKKEGRSDIFERKNTFEVPFQSGPFLPQSSLPASQSRLKIEFDFLNYLGRGAFGDVLKVRNKLDNREYAIKRIPLFARNKALYKKMTREVELLSRLNHENVVRYFNSWIENVTVEDLKELDKLGASDWSGRDSAQPLSPTPFESNGSSTTSFIMPTIDDDSSDGIMFMDSKGEVVEYDDVENMTEETGKRTVSPRINKQIMYIQMEFCEKSTLRQAIDDNLYKNVERLWRLFREIAEGLLHIHQQGIIHRDLKPVNIFLDSRDQIKIGDFGLATTSFLVLQSQEQITNTTGNGTGTGTGKVGTTLYVAPELTENAAKCSYNLKVDMYTLGIILFEMSNSPFETAMERVKTIVQLRSCDIKFPERILNDKTHRNTVEIIRWLLNHDPSVRPSAEELLASDLVPPAELEANELQEMMRHVLANPQSKAYKHLVARCLQQESCPVLEATYDLDLVSKSNWDLISDLEFLKGKVVGIFRKHGAMEINTPLLAPFSKKSYVGSNAPKLMTHSGCVVTLPTDLRVPFAKYIAMIGVNMVRRYSVERVYREKKVFNFHPKQYYECAFDIITPDPGNHLVDAELLSVACEIVNEIPRLKDKIYIRINHTSLLRAILIFCNVPKNKYNALFGSILDYIDNRISRFMLHSSIMSVLETTKSNATMLIDLLLVSCQFAGSSINVDRSALRVLLRGKSEVASLAKGAIRELESTISLADGFGVKLPIYLFAGLPMGYEHASSGGIVWQMVIDLKQRDTSAVLAFGERYDTMLAEFQKKAQTANVNVPNRSMSAAGFSVILDKIIAVTCLERGNTSRTYDVGVGISGARPPLKDAIYVLKLLWNAGIRTGFVEAAGHDEAQELARDLGANHLILFGEGGTLRIVSTGSDKFQEKNVTMPELIEFIQKLLKPDVSALESTAQIPNSNPSSTSSSINKNALNSFPTVEIKFFPKVTGHMRRRQENIITQNMSSTFLRFNRNQHITVMAIDLPLAPINAIVGAINPNLVSRREAENEIKHIIERYPEHRRSISEIIDDIVDLIIRENNPIVALYSSSDSSYCVII